MLVLQLTLRINPRANCLNTTAFSYLGGFYPRVAHRLENMKMRRDMTGRWIYPPLDKSMKSVGLDEVETYILRRQNTVAQYIATRPILELCLAVEQQTGARVLMRW